MSSSNRSVASPRAVSIADLRAERETRMNELRDYALALKEGGLGDEAKAE